MLTKPKLTDSSAINQMIVLKSFEAALPDNSAIPKGPLSSFALLSPVII